jgi:hypothetical protein
MYLGAADSNDFHEIKDWQLISSSVTTAASPGVKTYMKAFPGKFICIYVCMYDYKYI